MPAALEAPPAAPVTPPAAPSGPPMRGQGAARARMMDELAKRGTTPVTEARPAAITESTPAPTTAPATPPKAPDKVSPSTDKPAPAITEPKPVTEPPATTEPSPEEKAEAEARKDPKAKSAWRMVDTWKARAKALEKEVLDAKTAALPEQERKGYLDRIEKTEARLKEFEDEIRFVNYEKSPEFKEKFDEPYKRQWELAMSDLSEIPVTLTDGSQRPMKADDLMMLVGMPLPQATTVAKEAFGDFANEVLQHRREIKKLADSRARAVEEAKTTGATRDKERQEMFQKKFGEVAQQIKQTWEEANSKIPTDPKISAFITPREGDDEWNGRLEKGFALTDSALGFDPRSPNLTNEKRAELIRKQAAIRHRSAAFGALTYENQKLKAEKAELQAIVDKYKGSAPPAAGGSSTPPPASPVKGMKSIEEAMLKIARPA